MTMRTRPNDERGMSLIEVLVATAVLALAIIIALTVYDAARKSFKKGENATEQQEATRIAYDRLTADLRMLGLNSNPDGSTTRPDEQLEVALDHAIIFRGDFDGDDPALNNDHEGALAGGAFSVVSTGNDEVVGYVLAKPDGTGPDTITFQADVDDEPRDGAVTSVTVDNVAAVNLNDPPYTLYKISLNNNVGTCCNGDFIVRTPVVENIRSLTFQYFNGSTPTAIAAPGAAETATAKTNRAGVTRFNVSLVGMTRDPDLRYVDPTETVTSAKKYRKFELRGDVVPRNMRMKGIQDLNSDSTPPSKPATPTLLAGHCGALLVSWAGNASGDGVTQYRVNYGTTAGTVAGTRSIVGPPMYLDGLTTGSTYYVSIQAQDAAGNISIKSNEANTVVANTNTPSAPTAPSATTNQTNNVRLNWNAVTTNTASVPSGDPLAPSCRDLAGYRIYRGDTSGVTATTGNLLVNETVARAPGEPPHSDTTAVNCHTYYYKVTAVDACGTESAPTSAFSGQATSNIEPRAPTNVQAFLMGGNHATVTWSPVVHDVADNDITIKAYDVFRSDVMNKNDDPATAVFPSTPLGSSSTLSYDDFAVPDLNGSRVVYYMVKAKDECVNYSQASNLAQAVCAFSGTVTINPPADGNVVAGVVPTTVTVVGGTDTYTGVTITYAHSVSGVTRTYTSSTAGTTWTDSGWLAYPAGTYTITATVTNSTGCSSTATITVTAGSAVGCCLSVFPTTTSTVTCAGGSTKCKEVSYRIGNDRCLTAVSVLTMTVSWTDYSGNKPRWQTARFNGTDIAAAGSWTTTYVGTTNEVGTATKSNFSAPYPTVAYLTPMTSGNTTNVTYVFDKATDSGNGSNRKVDVFGTNQYVFTLLDSAGNPSGITTTCNLPSLTVN
jgi:prepilin-type N-terminal cleavage/methylation domain-containing protein